MGLREDLRDPGLLFAVAAGLLGWSIIGGLFIYIFEPQWRYREQRISEKLETTEVTYFAGHTWNHPIKLTRCPSFSEREEVWGETVEFRYENLRLAFPDDLPRPEDVDFAVDGNRFTITGYRYEIFEENVLTGARRQILSEFPRFDVVAWQVKIPYSESSGSAPDEDRITLEDRTVPVAHQTTTETLSPDVFDKFDGPAIGPCGRRALIRFPP